MPPPNKRFLEQKSTPSLLANKMVGKIEHTMGKINLMSNKIERRFKYLHQPQNVEKSSQNHDVERHF